MIAAAATSGTVTVTFTQPSYLELTIEDTSVAFGAVTPDVETAEQSSDLTVRATVNYDLTHTIAADFDDIVDTDTIPITRLEHNHVDFALGTDVSILNNQAPSAPGGDLTPWHYTLTTTADDPEGSYTADILYELTAH